MILTGLGLCAHEFPQERMRAPNSTSFAGEMHAVIIKISSSKPLLLEMHVLQNNIQSPLCLLREAKLVGRHICVIS